VVTKEQALAQRSFHRAIPGYTECRRYRRNGKTKTWKRSPERFQLPVIARYYGPHAYITNENAEHWHLESECPHGI
jgi:hypothetical protein